MVISTGGTVEAPSAFLMDPKPRALCVAHKVSIGANPDSQPGLPVGSLSYPKRGHMTHILNTARTMAEKTPVERNRVVDLVRVGSILIVVFGHWLMAAVMIENGEITAPHVLAEFPLARPLTWLLQVMPLFFFVGGYANALSWRSARRRGENYASWLRTRLRRLTLPLVPLLAVWGVLGWVALQAGFEGDLLRMASVVALGPTWFLAAYVLIVVLAPAALLTWERWGWRSVSFTRRFQTLRMRVWPCARHATTASVSALSGNAFRSTSMPCR